MLHKGLPATVAAELQKAEKENSTIYVKPVPPFETYDDANSSEVGCNDRI